MGQNSNRVEYLWEGNSWDESLVCTGSLSWDNLQGSLEKTELGVNLIKFWEAGTSFGISTDRHKVRVQKWNHLSLKFHLRKGFLIQTNTMCIIDIGWFILSYFFASVLVYWLAKKFVIKIIKFTGKRFLIIHCYCLFNIVESEIISVLSFSVLCILSSFLDQSP